MAKDIDFVTSLARGMSILTCFQAGDAELGNGQIARRAGLPPSTVARLTHTLTQLGYLRSIPRRRTYALSANVLSIGHPVLAALPERELARVHMKRLAQELDGAVCLAMCEGMSAVYIEAARSVNSGQASDIGTRRPLLDSSVGRALFVGLDSSGQKAMLNQLCLADPALAMQLREGADQAREHYQRFGMCMTVGLSIPGWSGIAMPLAGLAGRKLALSLGVLTSAFDEQVFVQRVGACLARAAARITADFRAHERSDRCGPTVLASASADKDVGCTME